MTVVLIEEAVCGGYCLGLKRGWLGLRGFRIWMKWNSYLCSKSTSKQKTKLKVSCWWSLPRQTGSRFIQADAWNEPKFPLKKNPELFLKISIFDVFFIFPVHFLCHSQFFLIISHLNLKTFLLRKTKIKNKFTFKRNKSSSLMHFFYFIIFFECKFFYHCF